MACPTSSPDISVFCDKTEGFPVINIRSVSALLVLIASPAIVQPAAGQTPDPHRAMLTTYCVTCHNARLKTGGIAFDNMDFAATPDDAQIWE
jgi:hypothetical protein